MIWRLLFSVAMAYIVIKNWHTWRMSRKLTRGLQELKRAVGVGVAVKFANNRQRLRKKCATGKVLDIVERLAALGTELRRQDNRCTADPIFLVQRKVRDYGVMPSYAQGTCLVDRDTGFPTDPGGWASMAEFERATTTVGYRDRWETVMPALTEKGAQAYLDTNGHNVKSGALDGEVRIYASSMYRCDEMVELRRLLMLLSKGLGDLGRDSRETK